MKTLLTLLATFITIVSFSQTSFGVIGGVGVPLTWNNKLPEPGHTPIVTPSAGIFIEPLILKGLIGFKTDVYYASQGSITSTKNLYHYFNIYPAVNFYFGNKVKFQFGFGPYMALLITANKDQEDISRDVRTVDAGVNLGIGIKIELPKGWHLRVEQRNGVGFVPLDDNEKICFYKPSMLFGFGFNID